MRKVIGLIIASSIVVLLLGACGGNNASGSIMDRIPKDDDYKPLTQVIEEQTGLLPNDMVLSPGKHNIYGTGIDISFPLQWKALEASGGRIGFGPEEHGEFYISVITERDATNYSGSLDDLPEVMKERLKRNLGRMIYDIEKFELTINSSEYLTVNGTEYFKIRGIVNIDNPYHHSYDQDLNYVAYYAVISVEHPHVNYKDRPVLISVLDYSEDQSHIGNAEIVLDAMVETLEFPKETD